MVVGLSAPPMTGHTQHCRVGRRQGRAGRQRQLLRRPGQPAPPAPAQRPAQRQPVRALRSSPCARAARLGRWAPLLPQLAGAAEPHLVGPGQLHDAVAGLRNVRVLDAAGACGGTVGMNGVGAGARTGSKLSQSGWPARRPARPRPNARAWCTVRPQRSQPTSWSKSKSGGGGAGGWVGDSWQPRRLPGKLAGTPDSEHLAARLACCVHRAPPWDGAAWGCLAPCQPRSRAPTLVSVAHAAALARVPHVDGAEGACGERGGARGSHSRCQVGWQREATACVSATDSSERQTARHAHSPSCTSSHGR